MCDKAVSFSCEAAYQVKIVNNLLRKSIETVGLYNECKCDFWFRLCEDARGGDACDYAAEYCCGDYKYDDGREKFYYLNSPLCYCDFFNYAQNEFGHTLKPKALNISKEFSNPCGQFENIWVSKIGCFDTPSWKDAGGHSCYWYEKGASWCPVHGSLQDGGMGVANDNCCHCGGGTRYEKISLAAIYNKTNGQNWTNNDGWMNETVDHCLWYGISCDDEGFVTSIDLRDNNLFGQFPVYTSKIDFWGSPNLNNDWQHSKYGLAKLYKLKTLDLAENNLTGSIEYGPLYNLNAITHFDVSGNQLSGEVETLVAPSLTHTGFSNNNFTSMRRFQKYKVSPLQTLLYCDVSNNAIQEHATDLLENIPPNIEQLAASNNQIYGSLPESLNNLQTLRQFNMTSNALSGELPVFADSTLSLQELDISFQTNGFTGSIPADLLKLQSLNTLNLAGNKVAGTIPRAIGFMAMLEVCDLSNNRLNGLVPPELGMLDGE